MRGAGRLAGDLRRDLGKFISFSVWSDGVRGKLRRNHGAGLCLRVLCDVAAGFPNFWGFQLWVCKVTGEKIAAFPRENQEIFVCYLKAWEGRISYSRTNTHPGSH